jgi:hypothetical protein
MGLSITSNDLAKFQGKLDPADFKALWKSKLDNKEIEELKAKYADWWKIYNDVRTTLTNNK